MRMRKKKNAESRLLACEDYLLKSREDLLVYRDKMPLELEIGCGKGGFICQMARRYPQRFFVALEVSTSALITALETAKAESLANLRFINANAIHLPELFEGGEVSTIYLNFSDPWPKARHFKRRLTYRLFLEKYCSVLTPNGKIIFKTDNRPLFDFTLEECAALSLPVTDLTYDLHNSSYNADNIMTEYEKNFSSQGFPIHRVVIHKKAENTVSQT